MDLRLLISINFGMLIAVRNVIKLAKQDIKRYLVINIGVGK